MPRHYKAKTDHSPIDHKKDLHAITRYFRGKGDHLLAIYDRWELTAPEHDDVGALVELITRRLIDFVLVCDAIPMRTPRKMMATVKEIAKRPAKFLSDVGSYDPEAVARVYDAFTRGSPENRLILSQFEAGEDTRPSEEAIAQAAFKVLEDLIKKIEDSSGVGGQTLVLQRELIQDLAKIFLRFGGSLKRSTQFDNDLPAKYFYHGPFHDFLRIVLVPVRPFARRAGFKMESVRSLVGIPGQEDQIKNKELSSLFGKHEDRGPERTPVRVGNFFKLHGHRLKNRTKDQNRPSVASRESSAFLRRS
jgi:hypothetical protein